MYKDYISEGRISGIEQQHNIMVKAISILHNLKDLKSIFFGHLGVGEIVNY